MRNFPDLKTAVFVVTAAFTGVSSCVHRPEMKQTHVTASVCSNGARIVEGALPFSPVEAVARFFGFDLRTKVSACLGNEFDTLEDFEAYCRRARMSYGIDEYPAGTFFWNCGDSELKSDPFVPEYPKGQVQIIE